MKKCNQFLRLGIFLAMSGQICKDKNQPFSIYDNLSNYFSLEMVSFTEFPEERRVHVNVAINIFMDRDSAGDLVQKCLNMQDKWKIDY